MMNDPYYTIKDCRDIISQKLLGIYPPDEIRSLALIILNHLTKIPNPSILARPEKQVGPDTWDKINEICGHLKDFTPIQYIIGESLFMGHMFKIIPGILIPRPETEELVDLIIRENRRPGMQILDIGTGSGNIAISLSLSMDSPFVTATDINPLAIETAKINSRINGASVNILEEDILSPSINHSQYDIIVSNPPYIRELEKRLMSPNVLNYEPHNALFVPDHDPLLFYRIIMKFAESQLSPGGKLYFEINESMGAEISVLADQFGYLFIRIIRDINGKDRIMAAVKNG